MHNVIRRFTATVLCFLIILSSGQISAFASVKNGAGMAEWALRAYNEGWKYVYGSEEVGAVDCSGLIRSYINGGGGAKALLNASPESGDISTMPNIHGLGLWCEGHAGVYVGKNSSGTNMAVDARNSKVNVIYSTMDSRSWNPWTKWFKVQGVEYPSTGWETFNGNTYYYHDGEFVTGIFTVEGETYDFGKSGALIGKADPTSATTATTTAATTTTKPKTTTAQKTTTTTATTVQPSLKKGMRGSEVTAVQKRLRELGYMDAKATGYFGKQTEAAVKAFQRAVSLTPDGIVGEATKSKLFSSNAPKFTTMPPTTTTTTTTTTTVTTQTSTATTTASTTSADATTDISATKAQTTAVSTTSETTAQSQTTTTTTLSAVEILLNMNAEQYNQMYIDLEFGTFGDEVSNLQQRLTDLGYYDSKIDGYFGVFLRIAVTHFQLNSGITETGIADAETQALLYSEFAPKADEILDYGTEFSDEEYMIDEGDESDESTAPQKTELEHSSGLDGYATNADFTLFVRKHGIGGALQTLGVAGHSEPIVMVVYDGNCFELTEELQNTIEECVFF